MSRRDNDPNRGNRSVPLSWFSAADALGLNDDDVQRDADVAEVVAAARRQVLDRERRDLHRLATILANTRPDDGGTEGEWALRLWDAGVRPPHPRPRRPVPLPLHRTEAGHPRCATCDGGGCLDCTDPA